VEEAGEGWYKDQWGMVMARQYRQYPKMVMVMVMVMVMEMEMEKEKEEVSDKYQREEAGKSK
jgi:hypothetical protein